MSADTLEPCPFCGSEAEAGKITDPTDPNWGGHFIQCTNRACGASTSLRFACGEDPRPLLAEQWNRRAAAPTAAEPGATPNESELLKIAIAHLAKWCHAIDTNGTGWDDWDEHYKDASYRPGPLRELIDAELAELRERDGGRSGE